MSTPLHSNSHAKGAHLKRQEEEDPFFFYSQAKKGVELLRDVRSFWDWNYFDISEHKTDFNSIASLINPFTLRSKTASRTKPYLEKVKWVLQKSLGFLRKVLENQNKIDQKATENLQNLITQIEDYLQLADEHENGNKTDIDIKKEEEDENDFFENVTKKSSCSSSDEDREFDLEMELDRYSGHKKELEEKREGFVQDFLIKGVSNVTSIFKDYYYSQAFSEKTKAKEE